MENKMKILLVEDNDFSRKIILKKLETAGYAVEAAGDGIQALNILRSSAPPDLILMDIMMPRLDGYKTTKLIKQDDRFAQIPVIMLTSKASEEDRMMSLEVGADSFVLKNAPFEKIDKLITKLGKKKSDERRAE